MANEEVFRFAQLRAPQKVSLTKEVSIPDSVSWDKKHQDHIANIVTIRNGSDLLIETLNAIVTGDIRTQYETTVTTYHAADSSANYIKNIKTLYSSTWFKGFDLMNDWIDANYNNATKTEYTSKFNEFTGNNLTDLEEILIYLRKIFRAWDNLVAQIIKLKDEKLREEIAQVIKVYEYSLLVSQALSDPPINSLFRLTGYLLILPDQIFPLPVYPDKPLPSTTTPPPFDYAALSATIANYKLASTELKTVQTYQVQDNYAVDIDPIEVTTWGADNYPSAFVVTATQPKNNLVTSTNYTEMLTSNTHTLLTTDLRMDSSAIHVDQGIVRIENKVTQLLNTMPTVEVYMPAVAYGGIVATIPPDCIATLNTDPCGNYTGSEWTNNSPLIENLFVADLKVVNKRLKRYEKGEIAHIENVLKNELRSREWRKTNRVSEELTSLTEDFSQSTNETSTTESSSLSVESSNVVNQASNASAGISITGSYGVVSATATAHYGTSNSKTNSNSNASNFAKEVTTRAQNIISKRVSLKRTTSSFEEIQEIIKNEFNNLGGERNIAGIYHWVDKVYECNLVNYGKRLMIEMTLPEPASFYVFSKSQVDGPSILPPKPIDPTKLYHPVLGNLADPTTFVLTNPVSKIEYLKWASLYGVTNVGLPPQSKLIVSKSYSLHEEVWYHVKNEEITIPNGFKAIKCILTLGSTWGAPDLDGVGFFFNVGKHAVGTVSGHNIELALDGETTNVPISFFASRMRGFFINIQIECSPTEEAINEWNIKTYNAIISKYEKDLDDFNAAVENAGQTFAFDTNGAVGEQVMRNELKKRSIEMLSQQRFESFDSTIYKQGANKYPEIDFTKVKEDAKYIKFFENSFDWENMTFEFYPYFWGRKPRWLTLMKFEGADQNFTSFMQAGAAKVVVPVKPEFTKSILHYINTSQVSFTNSDFVAPEHHNLLLDLRDAEIPTTIEEVDDKWEIKIPTTHIFLSNPTDDDEDPQLPEYFS